VIRWKLKQGRDKKVRDGHPWIFKDDLEPMGKSFVKGTFVEVVDHRDHFVGWGYGNHESRIAVRMLGRKSDEIRGLSIDFFVDRVLAAWAKKREAGVKGSFRLVYSEGDQMPGLIVDYYLTEFNGGLAQIYSAQILTAGMERILMDPVTFFRKISDRAKEMGLTDLTWDQSVLVIRNDSNSRKHEGLEIEFPKVLKSLRDIELNDSLILVRKTHGEGYLKFSCDLYQGQKTGFFLDQFQNIFLVNEEIGKRNFDKGRPVRVLDLCCYVGHWSVQLTERLRSLGYQVEVTVVDISASALERAKKNVERLGIQPTVLKKDVVKELGELPDNYYDVVIADPPAFAKSKKDTPQAEHAYMKMNTQSFRTTKSGGLMAACSCSGAVRENDFEKAVTKALGRSGREAKMIQKGGHAVDHPLAENFPEGHYLKMFLYDVR
jgi:23S rRNA (cytosine1962-C5)-methyltransferase